MSERMARRRIGRLLMYKLELDGTIVGRIGRPGNPLGTFGTLHMLDCRQENEILATTIGGFVHVIKLQP